MTDEEFSAKLGEPPSLKKALRACEQELLEKALEKSGGSPTKAAKLVGIRHQSFISRLNKFTGIKRTPVTKRRRSVIEYYLIITNVGPAPLAIAKAITDNVSGRDINHTLDLVTKTPGDINIKVSSNTKARRLAKLLRQKGATVTIENLPGPETSAKAKPALNSNH